MQNNNYIKCYGCKAEVKNVSGPKHAYIGSDAGCWEVFCNVLAKEYTKYNELWQTHRLTVDTYAAQHPGNGDRRAVQSVFIHLTRLYLMLEKGLSGKDANNAMKLITMHKNEFIYLDPLPDFSGTLNILDVAKAGNLDEHRQIVEKWAISVWNAWGVHHYKIKGFVTKHNIIEQTGKGKYERVLL